MTITRRPASAEDTDFARRTHHAAYRDLVERQFGRWDDAQQDAFFTADWESAAFEILLAGNIPIGYCAIENRPDDVHVRELVIDPSSQGGGIGTALIRELQEMAGRRGKPIHLGTLHENRAIELYTRLGFTHIGQTPTHVLMRWAPSRLPTR